MTVQGVSHAHGKRGHGTLRISSSIRVGLLLAIAAMPALAGCRGAVDLDAVRQFQEAQVAFDRAASPEDFQKVAALYQSILDRGIVSGAVLYNQGNAWMRANEPGRAIAAYRQAARFRPNDPYLQANLDYARRSVQAVDTPTPLVRHVLFWQDRISFRGKLRLMAVLATAGLGLGLAGLFGRRKWLTRSAATVVALTLIMALSAAYDWYRFDHQRHGVVVHRDVVARKGNARSYEPAFTEPLANGTEFELLQRRGDWLLTRLAGGQEGWIPADDAVVY